MKYWMDTEFIERPYTIDLISIGLVAEDGREFYAESSEVDWTKASHWTLEIVRPQLAGTGMPREYIGYGIREFSDADKHPVFWGYFPAYDWVAFCWLFGGMNDLPFAFPQLCLDIKQWAIELGDPELPHQEGARHHALADARWTKAAWTFLAGLNPAAGERRCVGRKNPDQLTAASACSASATMRRPSATISERTPGQIPMWRHKIASAQHAARSGFAFDVPVKDSRPILIGTSNAPHESA